MNVYGTQLTTDQIAAAKAAMRGTFRTHDIEVALARTGVADSLVMSRGADRLLQAERRAGRIAVNPSNKREWIAA